MKLLLNDLNDFYIRFCWRLDFVLYSDGVRREFTEALPAWDKILGLERVLTFGIAFQTLNIRDDWDFAWFSLTSVRNRKLDLWKVIETYIDFEFIPLGIRPHSTAKMGEGLSNLFFQTVIELRITCMFWREEFFVDSMTMRNGYVRVRPCLYDYL